MSRHRAYPLNLGGVKLGAFSYFLARLVSTNFMISCIRMPALFRLPATLLLALSFNSFACEPGKPAVEKNAPVYGYEVVHTWAHDRNAFTQGLVFNGGNMIESTGQVGSWCAGWNSEPARWSKRWMCRDHTSPRASRC